MSPQKCGWNYIEIIKPFIISNTPYSECDIAFSTRRSSYSHWSVLSIFLALSRRMVSLLLNLRFNLNWLLLIWLFLSIIIFLLLCLHGIITGLARSLELTFLSSEAYRTCSTSTLLLCFLSRLLFFFLICSPWWLRD